ncbi:MAG: GNAT family N-acetyltransferase [Acidimicrobiia bacterium]|nr:GNAT family N-acetyltransferase [Acidimicrobiia bacterium]
MLRRAVPEDLDALVRLVEEFYEVDRYPFDEALVRGALLGLLEGDEHGVAWLVVGPGCADEALGYAVVTWGYSIESGGREGLVDEFFVRERNGGVGSAALVSVLEACRAYGPRRLFLETEARNDAARRFYARHGFDADDSIWMSRTL